MLIFWFIQISFKTIKITRIVDKKQSPFWGWWVILFGVTVYTHQFINYLPRWGSIFTTDHELTSQRFPFSPTRPVRMQLLHLICSSKPGSICRVNPPPQPLHLRVTSRTRADSPLRSASRDCKHGPIKSGNVFLRMLLRSFCRHGRQLPGKCL